MDWEDLANCKNKRLEMFLIVDKDHPDSQGLGVNARKALTLENFKRAEQVCHGCPVVEQCLSTASEEDLYWTYRAGRVPGGFNQTNQGRPKGLEIEGKSGARKNPDGTCQRGHDDWNPYGRCRTCQKMHDKKAWERRKARNRGLIEADNLVD